MSMLASTAQQRVLPCHRFLCPSRRPVFLSSTCSFTSLSKDRSSLSQKLQDWLHPFVAGSKVLYQENQQAWALRRRLQAASFPLTRREMLLLRQAHRDLLKAVPLLVVFCVPLAGYVAPFLGYKFAKELLPWQFWRMEHKTTFLQEDAQERATKYPHLVQLLRQIQHKDDTGREMLGLATTTTGTGGLRPAQVVQLRPFFEGPAALDKLSGPHVDVLAKGSALFPTFAVLNKLLLQSQLQKKLERRMSELQADDQQLLKEGIGGLTLHELAFACHERGIVTQYGEIKMLRDALKAWLSMYDTDHFDPASNPQRLPSSLLLHAPALASFANLEEDKDTISKPPPKIPSTD